MEGATKDVVPTDELVRREVAAETVVVEGMVGGAESVENAHMNDGKNLWGVDCSF